MWRLIHTWHTTLSYVRHDSFICTTHSHLMHISFTCGIIHTWRLIHTGRRRLIGSPKLQIIFHKRATKYRSLLRKMTYKDKGSYESSPPCIWHTTYSYAWLIHIWYTTHSYVAYGVEDVPMRAVRPKDAWHDSFIRDTWLNSHARHDIFLCETWHICMRDMTHLYARHGSFTPASHNAFQLAPFCLLKPQNQKS